MNREITLSLKLGRLLTLTALIIMSSLMSYGQVTTSAMSGKISSLTGETLPGASIIATHTQSGTSYGTTTDATGLYRLLNMRVGGPYKIVVSFVGYETYVKDDIYLSLGQTFGLNIQLHSKTSEISGVEIVSQRGGLIDGNKTGASTNINAQQISVMPTISRSINDFTRLTPQTSVGNSFAGRDGRYNNITIDGANFNNNFGLSSKNLPGGDAQPISLDAIEDISVNIAPFDIRQSNFTGANVNAVTRSGDNTFKGSAYTYYRDKAFNGVNVGDDELQLDKSSTTIYGARLGGPILKDKLFFFANAEYEKSSFPGIPWRAADPENGVVANPTKYISRTTISDLKLMKQHLINAYGYDPGNYSNFGNFESANYKLLGRIDYNIHKNHKLTIRYNYVRSTNDQQVNATSGPQPRSTFGRIGEYSMAYDRANYSFLNTVGSLTAELNSILGNKISNKFLATYTKIRDTRDSKSDIFPFVDIYKDGNPYMSFGYELFSYDNDVKNNVLSLTDNVSYFLGKHTLTAGVSFEHLYFGNSFKQYGSSYYRFASMDDFINKAAPTLFGLTYPYKGAGNAYSELTFGWGSAYLQDEYQIMDNLKITGGVRFELPFYLDKLIENKAISDLKFKNLNKEEITLNVGSWPKAKLMISPRIGFNWDVKNDREIQVRGGTGLFTGRLPFVWFTNQPTNSGTLQNTITVNDTTNLKNFIFNKEPLAHIDKFPQTPSSKAPGEIAIVDKDFKMPQVWRTNIAVDYKLPFWNLILTLEALYSKDINGIIQYNANQSELTKKFSGADNRPYFDKTQGNKINKTVNSAIVLTNSNEGHSTLLTIQLSKPATKGFYGTLAYTYNLTKDLSANPGSRAVSAWQSSPSIDNQNNLELSYSQFAVPHRVIGAVSYNFGNSHIFNGALKYTTISLFYSGSNQGRLTYIYSNDLNGDGNTSDIMYMPKDNSEIIFVDIKDKTTGDVIYTAEQQNEAFWKYVDQDNYLKNNKGKYTERYGALMPWYHRFDLRILQDLLSHTIGSRTHKLQLSIDVLNIGNLINSNWGVLKRQTLGQYDITLLRYAGVNSDNVPTFTLNLEGNDLPTKTYKNVLSTASTWGAQVGLRYTF